jgi:hypothetical protein
MGSTSAFQPPPASSSSSSSSHSSSSYDPPFSFSQPEPGSTHDTEDEEGDSDSDMMTTLVRTLSAPTSSPGRLQTRSHAQTQNSPSHAMQDDCFQPTHHDSFFC